MIRILGVGLILVALLAGVPALAAEAPQETVEQTQAVAATPAPAEAECGAVPETLPQPLFLSTSTCVAKCTEGPDQVCTGSSCTATDQACPGTQGFCFSPEEGFKVCGACFFPLPCSGGLCP